MINTCETTLEFWDCECTDNYIKPSALQYCTKCGCDKEDCPDSRVSEVEVEQMEIQYAQMGFREPVEQ